MVQLRDKLTTQLDLIKQAQLKQNQQAPVMLLTTTKTTGSTSSRDEKTQEPVSASAMGREKDFSTSKALALSLTPSSVAMSLGPGSIPPTIITPPSNDQASSLNPPPTNFSRQVREY